MRKWKQLTETDVLRICAIIDGWPLPTITWEALIQEATIQLGQEYSRQALDRKPLIKQRFQVRKDAKPALMRMDEAEQTIQRQISRIEGLEEIVRQVQTSDSCGMWPTPFDGGRCRRIWTSLFPMKRYNPTRTGMLPRKSSVTGSRRFFFFSCLAPSLSDFTFQAHAFFVEAQEERRELLPGPFCRPE